MLDLIAAPTARCRKEQKKAGSKMTSKTALLAGAVVALTALSTLPAVAINPNDQTNNNQDTVTQDPPETNPVIEQPVFQNPTGETPFSEPPEKQVERTPTQVTRNIVPSSPSVMIYPQPHHANYCPQGLQPVTISGVISCGRPNKQITYQQMLAHPQPVRVHKPRPTYHRSAVPSCSPGIKGCVDR